MITTAFLSPTTVSQLTVGSEVAWNLPRAFWNLSFTASTVQPLIAVNNIATLSETNVTGQLLFSGWNTGSITGTLLGLEARVICRKSGRIRDRQIQLIVRGEAVGVNQGNAGISYFNTSLYDGSPDIPDATGDDTVYGAANSLWGSTITAADLASLQIAVRYQSGSMPHQDFAYCNAVYLRVTHQ